MSKLNRDTLVEAGKLGAAISELALMQLHTSGGLLSDNAAAARFHIFADDLRRVAALLSLDANGDDNDNT